MQNLRITRSFSFEMAHFLPGYKGPCRNIHGHSFKLLVTVFGTPAHIPGDPKDGMIIDFQELKELVNKEIICKYDHALLVKKGLIGREIKEYEGFENIIETNFQPTSEMLIIEFADVLKKILPENVRLYSLKLYETAKSYVEWFSDDQGENFSQQ